MEGFVQRWCLSWLRLIVVRILKQLFFFKWQQRPLACDFIVPDYYHYYYYYYIIIIIITLQFCWPQTWSSFYPKAATWTNDILDEEFWTVCSVKLEYISCMTCTNKNICCVIEFTPMLPFLYIIIIRIVYSEIHCIAHNFSIANEQNIKKKN